jgi:hypothetical protein
LLIFLLLNAGLAWHRESNRSGFYSFRRGDGRKSSGDIMTVVDERSSRYSKREGVVAIDAGAEETRACSE